jgi:hypothetical protein
VRKILTLGVVCCSFLTALTSTRSLPARPPGPAVAPVPATPMEPGVSKPPARAPTPTINLEPLVEQLGDGDYRKRDEAAQLLRAQGLAALPALRKALNHPDLEVRRRVQELIPAVEVAAIISPRRINYKAAGKPLTEVFNEINKQTGLKVEFWQNNPNVQRGYTFDFRDVTFWEALDRIGRETGLVIQQGYGDDRVRLQPQNGYVPYVVHDGAFRFVANNISQTRNVDLSFIPKEAAPPRRSDSLNFSFTTFVEPRLAILGISDVNLTAAYDNEKNSLLPAPQPPDIEERPWAGRWGGMRRWSSGRYGNRASSVQSYLQLNRVSDKATAIKVLRGTMALNLLAEQKPVVISDAILTAKGKKATIDGTTINILDITEQPNKQIQLKLSITDDNKDANDYSWMNTMYQRLVLQDARGNAFNNYGTSWGNSGPTHVELTMTFAPPGMNKDEKPVKLVFYSWTTMVHQLDFEFKDLPLP